MVVVDLTLALESAAISVVHTERRRRWEEEEGSPIDLASGMRP